MIDLRQRLSELDQLEAPDLRADIEERISTREAATPEPLRPERPRSPKWRGPLAAAATATAILLVVGIATIALRSESTSTAAPAATIAPAEASVDPTPISATDPWEGVIEVAFDGQECLVTGPTSVPAGISQPFVLTNTSGLFVKLEVGSLQGMAFSELAETQRAADGFVYYEEDRTWGWLTPEALSFDREARPAIELSANQHLEARSLTFGTDVVYLVRTVVPVLTQPGSATEADLITPDGYWYCGQLDVTAIEF